MLDNSHDSFSEPGAGAAARPDAPAGVIRILSQEVTSRIAAGEVIERPASVVKELAENALDANARNVHVELASGGLELVRVSDDGSGMSPSDLALCILPHATSKIACAEELTALTTLGFRGEALPSVASCSRFALTSSKRPDSGAPPGAWRIEVVGGVPARPEPKPAAGAFGSVVEVRDLFFNLPARAKFLKGAAAEAAASTDCLLRLALSRPDVGFSLSSGSHEIFSFLPCTTVDRADSGAPLLPNARQPASAAPALPLSAFLRRARDVLGRTNSKGLIELEPGAPSSNEAQDYRLYGLISPPALSRPNRSSIYLFVNGRPVKDRTLTSALLESCRHLLPPKRYPIAVLYLELPGSDVDINVHPTKAEVRFRIPGLVYSLFHHALRRAFGLPAQSANPASISPPESAPPERPPLGAPRPLNGQKTFDLWPHAAPSASIAPPSGPIDSPPSDDSSSLADRAAESHPVFARKSPAPLPAVAPPAQTIAPFRILGQAGGSYIVLEDDTGVKLIDQHALHERVLFEILFSRAQGRSRGDAQGLLIPETLELSPVQAALFHQDAAAAELLYNLGFDVAPFGPRTVAVNAVPAILKNASPAALVRDVLDALSGAAGAGGSDESAPGARRLPDRASYREKAAYVLSCKGAIKAGERLSTEQMAALVVEYRSRVSPAGFTCPHGRPVALELSWEEMQRAVGR